MKKIISIIAVSTLFLFSHFSYAVSIDEAKAQGAIGETATGYLASVKSPTSTAIKSLLQSINAKRKAAYVQKGAKAGVSTDAIAKRVAQRLFQKASKGSYLKNASGKWYKK